MYAIINFNPRPLAGDDGRRLRLRCPDVNFNPRPLAGDDVDVAFGTDKPEEFQSTSPCGGRHIYLMNPDRENNFNPRPLAGDDATPLAAPFSVVDFNPRPLAGDDKSRCATHLVYTQFQSTSPCGGRHPIVFAAS